METISNHHPKAHLSRLIDRIARGETFILAKTGKPVAKIVPVTALDTRKPKRLGFMTGELRVPADFDRMAEREIETLFVSRYPGPIRKI